jgi:ABC-2 type transport system ATP-binding protein
MNIDTILNIKNLNKYYKDQCVLNDFNLEVKKGQVWGILGPNGSGKTTTLSIILGALQATSGEYYWNKKHCRSIGSLLSEPSFYPWLKVATNLNIIRTLKNINNKECINDYLQVFDILSSKYKKAKHLSKGMQLRMSLAAATIGNPDAIILDEPTHGLDPKGIVTIRNIIKKLATENKAIILASHILPEIEKTCSHVLILNNGKTLLKEQLSELTNRNIFKIILDEKNHTLSSELDDDDNQIIYKRDKTIIIKSTLNIENIKQKVSIDNNNIFIIKDLEDLYMNIMEIQ